RTKENGNSVAAARDAATVGATAAPSAAPSSGVARAVRSAEVSATGDWSGAALQPAKNSRSASATRPRRVLITTETTVRDQPWVSGARADAALWTPVRAPTPLHPRRRAQSLAAHDTSKVR